LQNLSRAGESREVLAPFIPLSAIVAPMPGDNIDTDQIIPKQFLTTRGRAGLGAGLFYDLRFDSKGAVLPDFVLNKPGYAEAGLIAAGENFGCGSSREHAVWALLGFGIRCVIAPSFGEIFETNCYKNGLLPLRLSPHEVLAVQAEASQKPSTFSVNLESQTLRTPSGVSFKFDVEAGRKRKLLDGLDDIALTLRLEDTIAAFEQRSARP
jgi:3-isopropylmalate dehydratase small subunit